MKIEKLVFQGLTKTMTYLFPNNLITERFITEVRPLINLIYRNIESCLQR